MNFQLFRTYGLVLIGLSLGWGCRQSASTFSDPDNQDRKEFIADIDWEAIRERGYITAIMDNSSTGLFIYKGKTMGYEYDLLNMFCEAHDLELRINTTSSLEEAFNKLNSGEGDILAYNLTVTKTRKERIAFTHYHNLQKQVLIQRKPANWRQMKLHEIEETLIRNPVDLIGEQVVVRPNSSYFDRLIHLSDEIGGEILIVPADKNVETEKLIEYVADGKINYTVAEENISLVNATYYPILDVKTPISFSTQMAWGVRKNATELLTMLNNWILRMRKTTDYYVIYDKYFRSTKSALRRAKSDFFTLGEGNISPYDSLIKIGASRLQWDWRLLAAQIYKESKFNASTKSWAGAVGLMQVMPRTAAAYDVTNLYDPERNIHAGIEHLIWLKKQWEKELDDDEELTLFVLASYNVGLGHLQDAVALTKKYGGNPKKWDDVKGYLLKKSEFKYYTDPVVQYGYCRGTEPVFYVKKIQEVYQTYREVLSESTDTIEPIIEP